MRAIVITHCPLKAITEKELFAMSKTDKELIDAINRKKSVLEQEGIEIFGQEKNSIVTENGYYFAFFEEDLEGVL